MTKQNLSIFSIAGLLALTMATMPENAWATNTTVGNDLFEEIVALATGSLGVLAGLVVSLIGLWTWLIKQASWGLVMVIGGATVTAFPGIYASVSQNVKSAFDRSFGNSATTGANVVIGGGR